MGSQSHSTTPSIARRVTATVTGVWGPPETISAERTWTPELINDMRIRIRRLSTPDNTLRIKAVRATITTEAQPGTWFVKVDATGANTGLNVERCFYRSPGCARSGRTLRGDLGGRRHLQTQRPRAATATLPLTCQPMCHCMAGLRVGKQAFLIATGRATSPSSAEI